MVLLNARCHPLWIVRRRYCCRPSGLLVSAARPVVQQQQHHQQQLQQQRRSYVFWPSDWSELSYRWKLWWASAAAPTKIQIRLQQGYEQARTRARLSNNNNNNNNNNNKYHHRYQVQKGIFKNYVKQRYHDTFKTYFNLKKDRYRKQKFHLATKYHQRKALLQGRYHKYLQKMDHWQRRVQGAKVSYGAYYNRQRLNLNMASLFVVNARLTQKRRELLKRWTARRRDLMEDGKDYFRYYRFLTTRTKTKTTTTNANTKTNTFTVTEYCEPTWFDPKDGRPLTSRDPTGRFVNPWLSWSTNGVHSITNILKWRYQRSVRQWKERGFWSFLPKDMMQLLLGSPLLLVEASSTSSEATQGTPTTVPSDKNDVVSPTDIEFTWIGHSTCLVRMGHATILTDPIFSHRCSPFPKLPGVGVARDAPPSIALKDLPPIIDVCLISHDHYDHMDQLTILNLRARVKHWVLPKGLPQWLETRCSVDPETMTELEWWQSVHFQRTPEGNWKIVTPGPVHANNLNNNTMTITCCPAQHWSSRTFFDRCKRLWCGFAVETQTATTSSRNTGHTATPPVTQKFFFAGDTGMPHNGFPLFHQIGEFCGRGMYHQQPPMAVARSEDQGMLNQEANPPPIQAHPSLEFHPIDLAAIPIGAYDPPFLMREAHLNPEEALQCARQLQARKAVAIHWGTFALSEEPMEEPPKKLEETLRLRENEGVDFVCLPIGGSMRVPPFETTEKLEEAGVLAAEDDTEMAM